MMKNRIIVFLATVVFLCSCEKNEKLVDDPHQGSITIAADESFKSVTEALTDRYMALNPATDIKVEIKKEDLAFLDLLENKVRVIILSRDLTDREKKAYKDKIDLEMQPAKFAADAVLFITSKESPISSISMDSLKSELLSGRKNVIFDGTNSSNLNFVAQKFGVLPSQLKFSIIDGNKKLVEEINRYPGKIGVISLNTISRPYNKESQELKNSVKILSIKSGDRAIAPDIANIRDMSYPFTRILYFITNEPYYGLGNGLIRFSCQQLGQIVVQKEGLQPYTLFKREVQMR